MITNLNSNETKSETEDPKSINEEETANSIQEKIDFVIIYNKKKLNINFPIDSTVAELKKHVQSLISVPQAMQKVMFKGLAKDEQTLRSLGVTTGNKYTLNNCLINVIYVMLMLKFICNFTGAKVMVVGSKLDDVLAISVPNKQEIAAEESATSVNKEPLSQQKMHRKVLDKGIPDDAMPGILDSRVTISQS